MNTIKLRPFNDLWLDCINNNLVSMLIEVDDSFRDLPLVTGVAYNKMMTNQQYSTEEARLKMLNEGYLFPNINYSTSTIQKHIYSKEFSFEAFAHVKEYIKTMLSEGYYVFVTIDRYYYPVGREAGKTHMVHPVFIFGFDDEEGIFHAVEDCVLPGFMDFYKVPYLSLERSCLSLAEQGLSIKGSVCKPLSKSLDNAAELASKHAHKMAVHLLQETTFYNERYDLHYHYGLTSLSALPDELGYLLDNLKEASLFKISTSQFPQVHQRNQKLVALLRDNGYMSGDAAEALIQQYQSLYSQWAAYKKRSYYQLELRGKPSYNYHSLIGRLEGIISSEQRAAQELLQSLNKM